MLDEQRTIQTKTFLPRGYECSEESMVQMHEYSISSWGTLKDPTNAFQNTRNHPSLTPLIHRILKRRPPARVCFVSSFSPRECGIATFTKDLVEEIDRLRLFRRSIVVAVNEFGASYNYGDRVKSEIEQKSLRTYEMAADYINSSGIALSNLQHEFGLFGGDWGEYILHYLQRLNIPSVVTFHTVLGNPKKKMLRVVSGIVEISSRVIVMTRGSRRILLDRYGVPTRKVIVIPHGVPKVDMSANVRSKKFLSLIDKLVLSTFGLIHRGKGIEYAIRALPKIVNKEPRVLYLVLGETHPEVRKREGESYRNELMDLVESLGMEDHVRFHNRFLTKSELKRYLHATDIYIAPYLEEEQSSSGTLSYAMGFGKPVIATPFVHALEALGRRRGVLCKFKDSDSISEAVIKLLEPRTRIMMGRRAYKYASKMNWSAIAIRYAEIFKRCMDLR